MGGGGWPGAAAEERAWARVGWLSQATGGPGGSFRRPHLAPLCKLSDYPGMGVGGGIDFVSRNQCNFDSQLGLIINFLVSSAFFFSVWIYFLN